MKQTFKQVDNQEQKFLPRESLMRFIETSPSLGNG